MNELIAVITQIGKQKAFDANALGIKIKITHLAVGTGTYAPNENITALTNEKERVQILSSEINPTEQTITVHALLQSENEYWVNEVGFYLEDNTLFAIWSHPTHKLGYKSRLNKFLLGFRLKLVNVPINTVQIIDQGADLRLFYSEEFLQIGDAITLIGDAIINVKNELMEEVKAKDNAIKAVSDRITQHEMLENIKHYNMLTAIIANTAMMANIGDAVTAIALKQS